SLITVVKISLLKYLRITNSFDKKIRNTEQIVEFTSTHNKNLIISRYLNDDDRSRESLIDLI
ncbi:unnamed protein product, partial [Rotaria sp. Silwood2]